MILSSIAGYPIILPEHRHAFHQEHPNWHKAWLDSIHESLKPDDVVIDVGAEQGDLSALVASWVPDGGIVLVEPQPLFWPTIRETFEANGVRAMMTFPGFAGTDNLQYSFGYGERILMPSGSWPSVAYDPPGVDPGFFHMNEHQTDTFRIDSIDLKPSAILIDSEGSELHVLRGAEGFLVDLHPLVWCAIHPEIMRDRYGHDPNELLAFMYRMGYRWDLLAFAGEIHVRFEPR